MNFDRLSAYLAVYPKLIADLCTNINIWIDVSTLDGIDMKQKMRGFTLVELLIVVVIVGIVMAFGLPSLQGTIQNGRLTSQLNHMVGVIAFARNEASKRPNTNITICATSNPNASTPQCNTNDWENAYLMFSDDDGDQVIDAGADELLQVGRELEGGNTLRTSGFPNAGFIQFDARGIPNSSGTITICDDRGPSHAKAIVISVVGHVRVAVDQDPLTVNTGGTFPVNDHTGADVTCP